MIPRPVLIVNGFSANFKVLAQQRVLQTLPLGEFYAATCQRGLPSLKLIRATG